MKLLRPNDLARLLKVNPATARVLMENEIGTISTLKQYHSAEESVRLWLSQQLGHYFDCPNLELYGVDQICELVGCCKSSARKIILKNGGFIMRRRARIPKIYFESWIRNEHWHKVTNLPKTDDLSHHS